MIRLIPIHATTEIRNHALLRALLFVLPALLLSGCLAAAQSPIPPFLVKVTTALPMTPITCTGIALDATHVLTANHCRQQERVVTQTGQETWVKDARRWPAADVALLTVAEELRLAAYAELAAPSAGLGLIWATCPWYFDSTYRYAVLTRSDITEMMPDGLARRYDEWSTEYHGAAVCGGDSGGAILVEGKVVGLISAVDSDWWFAPLGVRFYAVNGARIARMIAPDDAP